MKLNTERTLKKLRKLGRDPNRFFLDYFRKRAGAGAVETVSATPGESIQFDTTDYDVDEAVVVLTHPRVVERLGQLKRTSSRPIKLSLQWWS